MKALADYVRIFLKSKFRIIASLLHSKLSSQCSSHGWVNYIVFLGKTLNSTVPLSTQMYKGNIHVKAGGRDRLASTPGEWVGR